MRGTSHNQYNLPVITGNILLPIPLALLRDGLLVQGWLDLQGY
jgi:hypothetical protein